jgi:hypothetical protein
MPNHCDTTLYIRGNKKLVANLVAAHVTPTGELNCDSIIPYPDTFKQLDEAAHKWESDNKDNPKADYRTCPRDGFNQGGYEWCKENWGTKWGTYAGRGIKFTTRGVTLRFNSAWSPPTPVITKLAAICPALRFQMDSYERGCAYQIHAHWKNGECVSVIDGEYRGGRGG